MPHRYIIKLKSNFNKDVLSKYKVIDMSPKDKIYYIFIEDITEIADYCKSIEYRPEGSAAWRPINLQYRQKNSGIYNDYNTFLLISSFAQTDSDDYEPNKIVGPWYLSSRYVGLYDVWGVTQGSGVTITAQEKFDFTHITFNTVLASFDPLTDWHTKYTLITGGEHGYMLDYYVSVPGEISISGYSNKCYFHNSGEDYGCTGCMGCQFGEPIDESNSTYENPQNCYDENYGSLCLNGKFRWDSGLVPSSFAPFGHGDIVTSIFGSRYTPTTTIDSYGEQIGPMGVAPKCNILLGTGGDAYVARESELGADIRIGAFNGQWSNLEATVANATGTILIRGPGVQVNCNSTYANGDIKPINTVAILPARYMGSSTNVLTATGQDTTVTGNYGMYAGYGRTRYADFAAPAVGVWANHPRYNYRNWGTWGAAFDGSSVSTAFGGGIYALMKALHTGWSWQDITTAICQSCHPYEIRTVPYTDDEHGLTMRDGDITSTDTSMVVTGNDAGVNTVNWYHAYPSGDTFHATRVPFSMIQFGTGPSDSSYELMLYTDTTSTDSATISGSETEYGDGTMTGLIRGYGGTIPKNHTNTSRVMYTPIIHISGWSEYLGWGLPDMRKAIAITKNTLGIMPPQRFTVTGIQSAHTYWGHKVQFVLYPFFSSNYGGIQVVKNPFWYPQHIDDGTVCYQTSSKNNVITGYDTNVVEIPMYYTAFQYTYHRDRPRYSSVAEYATGFFDGESFGYTNTKFTELVESSMTLEFSKIGDTSFARISGYYVDFDTPSSIDPFVTTQNTYTITGLEHKLLVSGTTYIIANSQNLLPSYIVEEA